LPECDAGTRKITRPQTDGYLQIRYAEEIGLGSSAYELIEL
jgi:uncharacterized Fe-S center protein